MNRRSRLVFPSTIRLGVVVSLLLLLPVFSLSEFQLDAQETFEEYVEVGGGSYKRGRLEEAEYIFRQAMELTADMEPLDPRRAVGMEKLAAVYNSMGDLEKARDLLEKALELRKGLEDGRQGDLALTLNNLAVIHDELGNLDRAVALYEAGLKAWRKAVGPLHPGIAVTRRNLAALYRARARYDKAERIYKQLLEARNRRGAGSSTSELVDLADVSAAAGSYEEAIRLYEKVISLESADLGPDHPQLAYRLSQLATCHLLQRSPAKAELLYRRSIELLVSAHGSAHVDLARPLNDLGTTLLLLGRHGEAKQVYEQALAIWEGHLDPENPKIANVLANLFLVHSYQGEQQTAQEVYARLASIAEGPGGEAVAIREALNHLRSETLGASRPTK